MKMTIQYKSIALGLVTSFYSTLYSVTAYADEQILTPEATQLYVVPGQLAEVGLVYTTASPVDDNTKGLQLRIHYDASKIDAVAIADIFISGNTGVVSSPAIDSSDFDNDVTTDTFIITAWIDISGNWPNAFPATLGKLNITTKAEFTGSTSVNFSGGTTGYTFSAPSIKVNEFIDNTPVFAALPAIEVEATATLTQVTLPQVSATDTEDGELLATPDSTGPFPVGNNLITWSVTDSNGQTVTAHQTVTVTDTTAPAFMALQDIVVQTLLATAEVNIVQVSASDLVDGAIVAYADLQSGVFNIGAHPITWTATDNAGNTVAAMQNIIVWRDAEAPVVTAPADTTLEATGATTSVTLGQASAIDTVDGELTAMADNTGPFAPGTYTITWSASDTSANTGTDTQIVTIKDTKAPILTLPADINLEATGVTTAVTLGTANASDLVDGQVMARANSNGPFTLGEHFVVWSATDTSGNTASQNQRVMITDTTAPVFAEITDLTLEASGTTTAVTLPLPVVSDALLDGVKLSVDHVGEFALGETLVTWTATDASGNSSSKQQKIVVVDTTPPNIDVADLVEIAALGKFTDISAAIDISASDAVDGEVPVSLLGAAEYESGLHHIDFIAKDSAGNQSTVTVQVAIHPQVIMGINQIGESGATVDISLKLSGDVAVYPVVLGYSLQGAVNVESSVSIAEGEPLAISVDIPDDAIGGDDIVLTLNSVSNAVLGEKRSATVLVQQDNLAPIAQIVLMQNDKRVALVDASAGAVSFTAHIQDVNGADQHQVSWSGLGIESSSDNTLIVDASSLSLGENLLSLTVTESNTSEALNTQVDLAFMVTAALPLLTTQDSDNDGITDSDEGFEDTDGDGIADYKDNSDDLSQLPLSEGSDSLLSEAGISLSLGSLAQQLGAGLAVDAEISEQDLIDLVGEELASNGAFEPFGPIVNFIASGLAKSGDSVSIVVPLASGSVLPANAEYRKFNRETGWFTFVVDSKNSLSSAARQNGQCPVVGADVYLVGLNQGDDCVLITIEDGGPYDADGKSNGRVEDPGVFAVLNQPPIINLAGELTVNEGDNVSISAASSTDPENEVLSFSWEQLSGMAVALTSSSSSELRFTAPDVTMDETMTFAVSVSDGTSIVTQQFEVIITFVNQAPVITEISGATEANEQTSVTLTAAAADADGQTLSYAWQYVSGPQVTYAAVDASSITFTLPDVTTNSTLTLEVTVSDGITSSKQTHTITIKQVVPTPTPTPTPPSAGTSGGGGSMGYILWMLLAVVAFTRTNLIGFRCHQRASS